MIHFESIYLGAAGRLREGERRREDFKEEEKRSINRIQSNQGYEKAQYSVLRHQRC